VLCGDSTNADHVARLMDNRTASLVLTDPPYGVGFARGAFITDSSRDYSGKQNSIKGDTRKGEEQRQFVCEFLVTLAPHVSSAASVYMFSAPLAEGCNSYFGMIDAGIHVQSQLVWNKNNLVLGQADYHWKHEICWYGWYEGSPHHWYGERDKTTVLDFARVQATEHPNEKPVPLLVHLIENSSKSGEIVAEPFGGSGSTIVACESQARSCFTMELDPACVASILERLSGLGLEPSLVEV
jgi:DNA modification methylase